MAQAKAGILEVGNKHFFLEKVFPPQSHESLDDVGKSLCLLLTRSQQSKNLAQWWAEMLAAGGKQRRPLLSWGPYGSEEGGIYVIKGPAT